MYQKAIWISGFGLTAPREGPAEPAQPDLTENFSRELACAPDGAVAVIVRT
jgi:hypothetical protein